MMDVSDQKRTNLALSTNRAEKDPIRHWSTDILLEQFPNMGHEDLCKLDKYALSLNQGKAASDQLLYWHIINSLGVLLDGSVTLEELSEFTEHPDAPDAQKLADHILYRYFMCCAV